MKHRLLKLFLVGILISDLSAKTHTEKTFLLPASLRFPTSNTLYNYSLNLISKNKKLKGGNLQVTSFFRRDQNKKEIGKYFGRNGSNIIKIGNGPTDFQASNIVFTNDPASLNLEGEFELLPYRRMRGVHLSYLQKLSSFSDRLFFNISLPFIHVARNMNTKVYCDETKQIATYFCGGLEQKNHPTKQEALKYAKIKCEGVNSKSGSGDVECCLSYQFNNNNQYYIRPSIGVVIPTDGKPNGEFLFEPVINNGGQVGVVAGVEAMGVLYESKDTKIDVTYICNVKHFFENTQKRTISFRSDDLSSKRSWAHYYGLLGEKGKKGVFPGANVLTRDVKVLQGLVFDFLVNYNVSYRNWLLSVGYNFFSRAAEGVKVKCWEDDTYALASTNYDTSESFHISADPMAGPSHNIEKAIQSNMLDTSVAESPASITHKIHFLISSKWDSSRVPVIVGVGGAYEFSQDNAALEGYELYVRAGASF